MVMKYWVAPNSPASYEYTNVTLARKKAYDLLKKSKSSYGIEINRGVKYWNDWRKVCYQTLADGKKAIVICDMGDKNVWILNPNGELGAKVNDLPIVRKGRYIGNMLYVGRSPPAKGVFHNYDTNKIDTYIRK